MSAASVQQGPAAGARRRRAAAGAARAAGGAGQAGARPSSRRRRPTSSAPSGSPTSTASRRCRRAAPRPRPRRRSSSSAIAQRDELQVKIAHTRVVAPAGGVISRKSATVGAVVQPGTELFRLIRDGELEWRAELPSHSLARRSGRRHGAHRCSTTATRSSHGAPGRADHRQRARATAWSTSRCRRGDSAEGRRARPRRDRASSSAEALALPESSVLTRDGNAFVFVVGARLHRAPRRASRPARASAAWSRSSAGLRAQDRVVGTGAGFVKDGDSCASRRVACQRRQS